MNNCPCNEKDLEYLPELSYDGVYIYICRKCERSYARTKKIAGAKIHKDRFDD
jgi:hypothetical protein